MTTLHNPKWMYAKAVLFLGIGTLSFVLLLTDLKTWERVTGQILMVWAFARAYYFAFYVIEHYVDGRFRFAGLLDFARYVVTKQATEAQCR